MTNFGFETTGDEVADAFSSRMKGRIFLITGTSAGGLGSQCAITLAKHSAANIILVSRSKSRVDPVIDEIHSTSPGVPVTFVQCELSDQDSVRQAAETILNDAYIPKIDVAINNAGVMNIMEYTLDKHGNELTLSSNHIGHFLLTNLLMPKILAAGPGARIVNLSSHGHNISRFRFEDPKFEDGKAYQGWNAYGQSKTANVLFTVELARRLAIRAMRSYAVDPGLVIETGLADHLDFDSAFASLMETAEKHNPGSFSNLQGAKTLSQGYSTSLVAALDPALDKKGGAYLHDCQVAEAMPYATDSENAKKLWAYSEELVGQKFDL